MVICCVVGCVSRPERKQQSFFHIPSVRKGDEETIKLSAERRNRWFSAIRRSDIDVSAQHHRVCSVHFVSGKPSALFETTSVDWVPSLRMGYGDCEANTSRALASADRASRKEGRKRKILDADSFPTSHSKKIQVICDDTLSPSAPHQHSHIDFQSEPVDPVEVVVSSASCPETGLDSKAVQTEMNSGDIVSMEREINELNSKLYSLTMDDKKCKVGTQDWFSKDEKVSFYTGLPNLYLLLVLFDFVSSDVQHHHKSALSQFQEFAMTLMRLRLNLTLTDLAYRFDVSNSTTSSIILKWIDILFVKLRPLVRWPSREDLHKTTPMSFRQHFKTTVAVIIDCFEVFCHQPSNLLARALTFSSYKHHNTIKFLIGITPQGVISFVSKAWGGRTSDRHLTENSGLLSHLLPGDVILADRGFDIADSAAVFGATVEIPAFTKGKKQLSPFDIERSRKLSSVRVHVERVIGLLRNKYTILQDTLPLDYLMKKDDDEFTTIDKIVVVCSALTNMCDSVIPVE